MNAHYDALETRSPEVREREQMDALARQVAYAKAHAPAFGRALRDVDAASITSRDALAQLPVVRKSELAELQRGERPFGGLASTAWGRARRVFASPGGIYEPEGAAADYWRLARALFAAGFRAGDLVHNCFSYHLTPAGSMLETGAHALGCTVFPGGVGQTEQQVAVMADLKPDAAAIIIFLGGGNDRPQIVTAQLADPPQRVIDALLFGRELRFITQVLPGASAAFADVRAGRCAACGRSGDNANGFADRKALLGLDDSCDDLISGRRLRHHQHPTIDAADPIGTIGKRVDV